MDTPALVHRPVRALQPIRDLHSPLHSGHVTRLGERLYPHKDMVGDIFAVNALTARAFNKRSPSLLHKQSGPLAALHSVLFLLHC